MPLIEAGDTGLYYTGGMLEVEDGLYSDAVEDGLTPTWLIWRGLMIASYTDPNTPFHLKTITGWDVTPQISFDDVPTAGGRGVAVTPGSMGPRIITVTGWCHDQAIRNRLLAILQGYTSPRIGSLVTEPLTVTHGGLTLSADAQLVKSDPTPEVGWGLGRFGFSLQWRCPDPMRYGDQSATTVPITVPTLGITFGVTGDWVFPVDPVGGPAIVYNGGTADADAVYTLIGPMLGPGVAVLETGHRVLFDFNLGEGDVLSVDTAAGLCTLNGEYRSPIATSSLLDEMRLPAHTVSTVQPLGTPQVGGSPSLSVSYRPAYW
jgi:hypothetical protein